MSKSLIVVVSGPGGVGKSTIVEELVKRDARLWLSRSWTTREQRPGEAPDAYKFVTREQFQQRIDANGFLEWTEFIGNLYGTPNPEAPTGRDIVLEIEVDGAQQVKQQQGAQSFDGSSQVGGGPGTYSSSTSVGSAGSGATSPAMAPKWIR